MKAFFTEVLAAIKEGPALFFAPITEAIKVARVPARQVASIRRPMK